MRFMSLVKSLSVLGGLSFAGHSYAISLGDLETYKSLVPSSTGKSKPSTFEKDMTRGIKVDKAKQGCRFAEKNLIYMFDDVVVYTDAADTKFTSYKVKTVLRKGCSLPMNMSGFTPLPDGGSIAPLPYGTTPSTAEADIYSTKLLEDLAKGAELDPIELGKDQEAGMTLLQLLDQGVQVQETQLVCKGLSKKPMIYMFPDWTIFLQDSDDGAFYDAVRTSTVRATPGCVVPNFVESSGGATTPATQCVQAPRIETDGLVGTYRQGFSLDSDASGQPISGSNRVFAYILKKTAAASPSIVNDVRKVVAVTEKVTLQPNVPTIVRIDNDQVVFAGSTKTGARIVAIDHQSIAGSDVVTVKDLATGFAIAGLSKGDSFVFKPEDPSFFENFTNIGLGIYFRQDGLVEMNYKDPRIGSRFYAYPSFATVEGFGPTEGAARDYVAKTCTERNILYALRGEPQNCITDTSSYTIYTQNGFAIGSVEKNYNVTANLCDANPAVEDLAKRPVELVGKYIKAEAPTRHTFNMEAGRREWYFVAKLSGKTDFIAKAKDLISYAKKFDLTLEPASTVDMQPSANDVFLIAYVTVQGVRADFVKYDAAKGALQKFYNLDANGKVEFESDFEINPASSDLASDVNSLLKYYIGLDYSKATSPVNFNFTKSDLY